jgi:hypothetical protein
LGIRTFGDVTFGDPHFWGRDFWGLTIGDFKMPFGDSKKDLIK